MKKITWIAVFFLFGGGLVFSQWFGYYPYEGSALDAGLGMTWIDNQTYYTISFHPDIGFGKFGIGLGINLLYNADTGHIRSQDWNSKYDYARILRYLRYGHKGDRLYSRIGALDAERIGHGFIMNFYNNQLNYEERKLGLTLDADLGYFGFESLTNNLGRLEVLAGRGYFRPLYGSQIPVLKNFAVGVSYVTDLDPDSWRKTKDGIAEWGADVEFPLVKSKLLSTLLYADYAKILDYGSGQTVGLRTDFNPLANVLQCGFAVERRFLGKEFVASYFGPFYEILRQTTVGEVWKFYESIGGKPSNYLAEVLNAYFKSLGYDVTLLPEDVDELLPYISDWRVNKEMLLPMMTEKRSGWYAELYLDFLRIVRVMGSYQMVDKQDNSGMLHLGAGLSPSIPFLALEASYDKWGIGSFKDMRKLDYRSVARIGIGYKITPYLLFYLDYLWYQEWNDELGDYGMYQPRERFQPRLAYRYNFSGF